MLDKETVKKKIFILLEDCNEQLGKYKDLRSRGMAQDETFEATLNTRKQTLAEILEMIK